METSSAPLVIPEAELERVLSVVERALATVQEFAS